MAVLGKNEGLLDFPRGPLLWAKRWRARQDLNPRPSVPKTDALSAELRARYVKEMSFVPGRNAERGRQKLG